MRLPFIHDLLPLISLYLHHIFVYNTRTSLCVLHYCNSVSFFTLLKLKHVCTRTQRKMVLVSRALMPSRRFLCVCVEKKLFFVKKRYWYKNEIRKEIIKFQKLMKAKRKGEAHFYFNEILQWNSINFKFKWHSIGINNY